MSAVPTLTLDTWDSIAEFSSRLTSIRLNQILAWLRFARDNIVNHEGI